MPEEKKPIVRRTPAAAGEKPRIDPRTPTNQVPGGRCANCNQIFIKQPLYRDRGTSFVCKECVMRLKEERARTEPPVEDDYEDNEVILTND